MSSARGGSGRVIFDSTSTPSGDGTRQPRPGFQRGRGQPSNFAARTARGMMARGMSRGRGTGHASPGPPSMVLGGDPPARFQALKKKREEERKDAIRNGFLSDPDKPRTLAEAITPVGTCPDMCAEFERLERIVQKDVWSQELGDDGEPDEARMVKKFRRAAAGIDEQLPSDLRPPATLKKTCDYLFDDLIGGADALGTVHHLVWDRTRAIRNDFSIQQITKPTDVEIAIDCYERIARFHILSLHQFAIPDKPHDKYDWYQEREQLDRTLLSLMQYYDDNRGRLTMSNEAEFRAYCIVLQIQDPIPDLEERVSCYPREIRTHPRVRTALELYSAACSVMDPQGPLKPKAKFSLSREDWNAFFTKVESRSVSYLMACAAEVYFNTVRKQILNGLWRAFRRAGSSADITDLTLSFVTQLLRFDDDEQTRTFCEHYGFGFKDGVGQEDDILDINAVSGKTFPESAQGLAMQNFSQGVVEMKRLGRTFPAIIRALSYKEASMMGMAAAPDQVQDMSMDGGDSLFVSPAQAAGSTAGTTTAGSPFVKALTHPASSTSPFQTASNPFATPAAPSTTTPTGSPFAPKAGLADSIFATSKPTTTNASGWGRSSSSTWAKPVSTGWGQTLDAASAVVNATPLSPFGSALPIVQAGQNKTSSPSITSIHAPPAFQWGKPATTSWSSGVTVGTVDGSNQGRRSSFTKPHQAGTSDAGEAMPTSQVPPAPTVPSGASSSSPFAIASNQAKGLGQSIFAPSAGSIPVGTTKSPFSFGDPVLTQTRPLHSGHFPFASGSPDAPDEPSSFPTGSAQLDARESTQYTNSTFSFDPVKSVTDTTSHASHVQQPLCSFGKPATPLPTTDMPAANEAPLASAIQTKPLTSASTPQSTSVPAVEQGPLSAGLGDVASSSNATPRARSTSPGLSQRNQPKNPSPLSQSFTADDRRFDVGKRIYHVTFDTPEKQSPSNASRAPFTVPTTQQNSISKPSAPSLQAILKRLATGVMLDSSRGLLRQFVEYHARPIIMNVYEELYLAEIRQIADDHRREKLGRKYGRRWRETSWKLRLARQGRERREKRRNARRDHQTHDNVRKRRREEDAVDEFLHRQSIRSSDDKRGSTIAAVSAARRSPEAVNTSNASTTQSDAPLIGTDTKRTNPPSLVKPATPAPVHDTTNRTSHFLGFSVSKQRSTLGRDATPRQSSASAYFRLRALGIDPTGNMSSSSRDPPAFVNIRKRSRSEEESGSTDGSPPSKKVRTPPSTTTQPVVARPRVYSHNSDRSLLFPQSPAGASTPSRVVSRPAIDSDNVLARARALRESIRANARDQSTPDRFAGQARPSRGLDATPAMSAQRARLQSRLRAAERAESSLAQSTRSVDTPAYRMRESRFVPREHYARAIERAHENAERRLRPESALSIHDEASVSPREEKPVSEVTRPADLPPILATDTPPGGRSRNSSSSAEHKSPDAPTQQGSKGQREGLSHTRSPIRTSVPECASVVHETASLHDDVASPQDISMHDEPQHNAPASQQITHENSHESLFGTDQPWSFDSLGPSHGTVHDAAINQNATPYADAGLEGESIVSHFDPVEAYAGAALDLSRIASSPYLGVGQNARPESAPGMNGDAEQSLYPNLSGSTVRHHYPLNMTEPAQFAPYGLHHEPLLGVVVDDTMTTDSVVPMHMAGGLHSFEDEHEIQPDVVPPSIEVHLQISTAPIDPNLLQPEDNHIVGAGEGSAVDPTTHAASAKAAFDSSNPFAVLGMDIQDADGDGDGDGDGLADEDAAQESLATAAYRDRPSPRSRQVSNHSQASSSSTASTASAGSLATRQTHDDHSTPNGMIRDHSRAAQREDPDVTPSLTSLARTDDAPGSASVPDDSMLSQQSVSTPPIVDGPARHTRSRSREMSALQASGAISQIPISGSVDRRRSLDSSVASRVGRARDRGSKSVTPPAARRSAVDRSGRHKLMCESPITEVEEEPETEEGPGIDVRQSGELITDDHKDNGAPEISEAKKQHAAERHYIGGSATTTSGPEAVEVGHGLVGPGFTQINGHGGSETFDAAGSTLLRDRQTSQTHRSNHEGRIMNGVHQNSDSEGADDSGSSDASTSECSSGAGDDEDVVEDLEQHSSSGEDFSSSAEEELDLAGATRHEKAGRADLGRESRETSECDECPESQISKAGDGDNPVAKNDHSGEASRADARVGGSTALHSEDTGADEDDYEEDGEEYESDEDGRTEEEDEEDYESYDGDDVSDGRDTDASEDGDEEGEDDDIATRSYTYSGQMRGSKNAAGSNAMTPGEMQDSGLVKGGTGQSAEEAFELSD